MVDLVPTLTALNSQYVFLTFLLEMVVSEVVVLVSVVDIEQYSRQASQITFTDAFNSAY